MNTLVKLYRNHYPADDRPDDAITLELAKEFPETLNLPEFKSDFDRIQKAVADANKPGPLDYVKQAAGSAIRSFADMAAAAPEALAITAHRLQQVAPMPFSDPDKALEDYPTMRAAQAVRDTGAKISPEPVEELQDSFGATKVPQAIGSALAFMAGGAATKVLKIPSALGVGGLGAAAGGVEGYKDADAKGATDDQKWMSFLLNAGVGTTELLPLNRMLKRLEGMSGGSLSKALLRTAGDTLEEVLQESFQSGAGDIIAKNLVKYDPDRVLFSKLKEDAAAGGITGLLLSLVTQGVGRRAGSSKQEPEAPTKATESDTKGPSSPSSEPSSPSIDPAEAYQLDEPARLAVENLARREAEGDRGEEVIRGIAGLYASNNRDAIAVYLAAKVRAEQERQIIDAAMADPVPDAVPAPAAAPPAPISAAPEPAETELEYAGGEAPDTPVAFPVPDYLQRARQAAGLYGYDDGGTSRKVAAAVREVDTAPSEGQKAAGNYSKGHLSLHGLPITIENPKGSTRSGKDRFGQPWSVTMPAHYGYVKGTEGNDGDQVDVYIGPNSEAQQVWVIDQQDPIKGSFDEHKAMIGFNSQEEATMTYAAGFSDGLGVDRIREITPMSMQEFKNWLKGSTKKPVAALPRFSDRGSPVDALTRARLSSVRMPAEPSQELTATERTRPWTLTPDQFWNVNSRLGYVDEAGLRRKHKEMVETALRRGEHIPKTVLAHYPDIAAVAPKEPWEMTPEEWGTDSEDSMSRRMHRRFVEMALVKGEAVPERVLTAYPGIVDYVQAEILPNLVENRPPRPPRAARARRSKMPKPTAIPEPWLKHMGPPADELLDQVDFVGAQLVRGKASAQAFVENPDETELFKSARHDQSDRGLSTKLGVFLVPGGSHVVVGTAYSNGEGDLAPKVTLVDENGNKRGMAFKFVSPTGFKLIASLKTKNPTKAHLLTYSLQDWLRVAEALRSMKASAQRTAVAVDEQLQKSGFNRQDEKDDVPEILEIEQPEVGTVIPEFDSGLAATIYDLLQTLSAAKGHPASPNLVRLALARVADGGGRHAQSLGQLLLALKANGLSYEESVTNIEDWILNAHHQSSSSAEFAQAIGQTDTSARRDDASLDQPVDLGQADRGWPSPAGGQIRFAERKGSASTASSATVTAAWRHAIDSAIANGLDVSVIQGLHEGGQYSDRAVALTVADPLNPSSDNLVLLFHEIAHDVFAQLPKDRQEAIHRAIAKLSTPEGFKLRVDERATAPQRELIEAEERLVEHVARDLVSEGFTPGQAQGIIRQILRVLKELYLRAAMAVQEALLGGNVNQGLAVAYIRNRLESFLAGDTAPTSLISFLGGPKLRLQQRRELHESATGDGEIPWFVDHDAGGRPAFAEALPDSAEAIAVNEQARRVMYSSRSTGTADQRTSDPFIVSSDLNSPPKVAEDVAAWNVLGDVYRGAFDAWVAAGHNGSKVTLEQFVASGNFIVTDSLPAEKVAQRNRLLEAQGFQPASSTTRIPELAAPTSQMQASAKALRYTWSLRQQWSARRKTAEANIKTVSDRLNRSNVRLRAILSNYNDAQATLQGTKDQINGLFQEFRADVQATATLGRRLGTVSQVIHELEGQLEGPVMRQYEVAINQLWSRFSEDHSNNPFLATLRRVAELGTIDWHADSARQIKDKLASAAVSGDPNLSAIVDPGVNSRALLSLLVAFGKRNAHVMDLLQLRVFGEMSERITVNEALKTAMLDSANAIANARIAVARLPKLAQIADRLLTSLEQIKAEHRLLLDEIQRDRAFIDFHDLALPILQKQMVDLERRVGATEYAWEPTDGAEYYLAPAPTSTSAQVQSSRRVFRLKAGGSNVGEIRTHVARNKAWLAAVPDADRGALWNTVAVMTHKLETVCINFKHEGLQSSIVNNLIGSIGDRLDLVGLPSTRSAAARLRRNIAERRAAQAESENLGIAWNAEETKAMRALGLKHIGVDRFRRMFFHTALDYAEKRQDILASHQDPARAFEALLPHLRAHFEADPDTREHLARSGAWMALGQYYRASARSMAFVSSLTKKLGIKILEEGPDGFRIYRSPIGATFFTSLRRISRSCVRLYYDMRELGWLDGTPLQADRVRLAYVRDPQELREMLETRFTRELWNEFVRPLAYRQGRAVFYGVTQPDGLTPIAAREQVVRAFEAANGDPVTFAEALYDQSVREGSPQTKAEFVGGTLQALQEFFDSVHRTQAEAADATQHGMPTPPRLLQDARASEEWPGDWLDYHGYGRAEMHQMVTLIANQAAYGRNIAGMRKDLATAETELRAKAAKFKHIVEKVEATNPKASDIKRLVDLEVQKLGQNPTAMRGASANARLVHDLRGNFEELLRSQNGAIHDLRWFQELVSSLAGATVQGPGTAIIDMATIVQQPFGKFGISSTALRVLGQTGKSLVAESIGSLAQAFHFQVHFNAGKNARRARAGYVDPDSRRKIKDTIVGVLNDPTSDAMNPVTRAIVKGARSLRLFTSTGIGKAPESGPGYVSLKPHAVFSQLALQSQFAAIDGWTSAFEDMAERAITYFQDPAHAEDFRNMGFQFTGADQLGYGKKLFGFINDRRAFDYMSNALNRYGMSLEQIARDTISRRESDSSASPLTDDQFRHLASLVQNEVTLDSNPATRPAGFFTNPLLRLSNPMLGWSIARAHDTVMDFRAPSGEASARAFLLGVKAYLAIVPISIAWAMLRDEYDEEVLGKKSNRPDPNSYAGVVDALGRVGTFGIWSDMTNAVINRDTERPFSVDNRVYFVASLFAAGKALGTWWRQEGTATYPTVGRPLVSALGGSGYLQYVQLLNNALSLDNAEARVTARINATNQIRVVGRTLGFDVRTRTGFEAVPHKIKSYIGLMTLSAYAGDTTSFIEAYHDALAAAKEEKKPDPRKHVKESYEAYHPLGGAVFNRRPTAAQYRRLLLELDDDARADVSDAVRQFNRFGEIVGMKPFVGKEDKSPPRVPDLPTLDDIRQRAAAWGN